MHIKKWEWSLSGSLHCRELEERGNPSPERRLLIAILNRALMDYCQTTTSISKEERRTAEAWLMFWFPGDEKLEFSFPWVCSHLGMNPHQICKELESPTERKRIGEQLIRIMHPGKLSSRENSEE